MVFGKMGTDSQERINYDRMRRYRLERVKEQMNKYGVGALITWDPTDMRYIAGYVGPGFIVLPRNGDPYVYVHQLDGGRRVEGLPWLKGRTRPLVATGSYDDQATEERRKFIQEIANIMDEHGAKNDSLILSGDMASLRLQESFKEAGVNAVHNSRVMMDAKKIKNQDEIECLRIACANVEASFDAIKNAIKPGITECELVGIGAYNQYRLGADDVQPFPMASGERTNPIQYDFTDRQIRPGDLIISGWRSSFRGYQTCYFRTFCCGKATAEQKELYEGVLAVLYDGMNVIKAGNNALDVVEKWPADPRRWGYDNWNEEALADSLVVHHIGMGGRDFGADIRPYMPKAMLEKNVLEENMTLAVEASIGTKDGKYGLRIEEEVVVTKDGYEMLSQFPIDELIECWT